MDEIVKKYLERYDKKTKEVAEWLEKDEIETAHGCSNMMVIMGIRTLIQLLNEINNNLIAIKEK